WWMKILEKYIQQASIDTTPNIRVLACDCLATMAKAVFENFPVRYQRLAIALLLPLPDDEESQVRAAACRALGAFVLFPTLRQDTCFVSDMATVLLDRMEDQVILVRLRASWAQGNLCDALVIASDADGFDLREWISIPTWMKMTSTATSASLDNDKLRSNAVRAIGSLLRITPLNYFQDRHGMLLVRDALTGLVKNIESGSLKTRWNACHAASNALKNRHFPIGYRQQYDQGGEMYKKEDQQEYPWTRIVFQTLTNALQCKNYKVRINACLALATPHQRSFYGHHLVPIYHALMSAWSICHDPNATTEYQEYKYQDQLKTQVQKNKKKIMKCKFDSSNFFFLLAQGCFTPYS
ncbi:armadillo-type protein, partial [Halteromyces radiatus]|uniref:armadillo-type protein n=1 Tax=Halteromyces radiatus TaxID=101107 RepID=UPI0022206334